MQGPDISKQGDCISFVHSIQFNTIHTLHPSIREKKQTDHLWIFSTDVIYSEKQSGSTQYVYLQTHFGLVTNIL